MAEPENRKQSDERVKLFVGQVPKQMTEAQLLAMFKEFALVDEVNIIKDKTTRTSRGCCFATCPSRQEADKVVNACHNKKTLPGASSPLQVKYADGELERLEHKLFVGMLPKIADEAELSTLFSKYGTIKDLQILKGSQQTSKGCAFLKYETKEEALSALEALNGKHKMEGSGVPLVVKWADTEKERQARRAQKAQSQVSKLTNADSHSPSVFGALPMGYLPSYGGYGYHAPGTYGYMQYRFQPMQGQAPFPSMIPQVNQGLQYPMAYPRGMLGLPSMNSSPGSLSPVAANPSPTASAGVGPSTGVQAEGPPGANLFIYNIPQEYGDQELANAFQPFGRVLSAKVFVDKATGASKCFGFVSYDLTSSAQTAINMMNGRQLGGKKLKVQHKRDNKQNKSF